MPAYNAAATIRSAIASVFTQTKTDWQLVVVDDGSLDETAERVAEFSDDPRIELVQQENRGLAAARNAGITRARGNYISLFDSDDLWMPDHLAVMARALEEDSQAAYAYTDAWVLDDSNRRIRRTPAMHYVRHPDPAPTDPAVLLSMLLDRNFISANATLRRTVLERVGLFNPNLRSAEDYELWLRMAALGYRGVLVPRRIVIRREHSGSLSSNTLSMSIWTREVHRLVAEEYDVPDEIREKARAAMRIRDQQIARLERGGRLRMPERRLRRAIVKLRDRLLWRRLWFATPPHDVASVYPDLHSV